MYGYTYYSPFHFIGTLVSILVWILVVVVTIKIIKHALGCKKCNGTCNHDNWKGFVGKNWGRNNAIDILKERYAKGEIQKDEFESKKKDLEM